MTHLETKRAPTRPASRHRWLLAPVALAGCQTTPPAASTATIVAPPAATAPAAPAWAALLQAQDLDRLQRLDAAWSAGLAAARRGGFARRVQADGALLDPAGALPRAAPAPGSYRCRLVRLGAAARRRAYTSDASSFCYVGVEGPLLSLTRQTGTTRPGGYLHTDTDTRQIFIGAAATGREEVPPAYGNNPARNVSGIFERVGPFRYRLVVPWPADGAAIEVLELIPAPSQAS